MGQNNGIFIKKVSRDQAGDTGMAMTLLMLILGFWTDQLIFFKIAVPVILLAMVIPGIYRPVAILWLNLSHMMGLIVSKLLLTLVFFIIVTPMGLMRRLFGRDPLKLKEFKKGPESVMKNRDHLYQSSDLEQPF